MRSNQTRYSPLEHKAVHGDIKIPSQHCLYVPSCFKGYSHTHSFILINFKVKHIECNFVFSGDPPYQVIELQIAMFMDLPSRMNPGLFVVASDCIELFNSEGDWSLTKPGFTALAHPSPVIIGTTHGVFVLADHEVKTLAFT